MKTKIIIVIVIILAIIGLAVYGYLKAIPQNSDEPAAETPTIAITPQNYNFGEINYGDVAEYTFTIENKGGQNLEIKKVATSCGCTTAKASSENIAPGEKTDLQVTYNTAAMSGEHAKGDQERIIYVRSNDPNNPQAEVTINAHVN